MEPPPAPMVWISSIGTATGMPATRASVVMRGAPSNRATSVLVPPMSNVIRRSTPSCSPTARAATSPPAGPDSTILAALPAASRASITPPAECMTNSLPRWPPSARSSRSR